MAGSDEVRPSGESRELVIALEPNSLGEFILGLLGQRRSIEQHFRDRFFLIDLKWMWNLDEIVDQRISAQNVGTLVSFSAKLYFDDGRITHLTSRPAFRAFHDISTRIAIGVDLGWTYLIKFPNSKSPEKQEIRFRAFTDVRAAAQKPKATAKSNFFLAVTEYNQDLFFSVSFTDLTWGEDIANHISSFIRSKSTRFGWVTRIVRSLDYRALSPLVFTLGMMGTIFFSERDNRSQHILQQYGFLRLGDSSALDMDHKLSFLVDASISQLLRNNNFIWPMIQLFTIFVGFSLIWWALSARKASFISLNEHSEKFFGRTNHLFEVIKYGVILSSVVGIVGGIFANTIYDYIKTWHLF